MNEKMQYATMLEMPFSTANVTVMPPKKRKKKTKPVNVETVKEELIQKVNAEEAVNAYSESYIQPTFLEEGENSQPEYAELETLNPPARTDRKKSRFSISVIAVQIALIGALIATIFITNAVSPNSGINTFFKGVFSSSEQSQKVDERLHSEFTPVIALDQNDFVLEEGVMTLSSTGSIYSPCDGVITSLAVDGNGRYTVEIEHSKNFKSKITGLDYIYAEQGDSVYSNIPVGYMKSEGATLCFTGADGSIISGYQIVDNSVVWAV